MESMFAIRNTPCGRKQSVLLCMGSKTSNPPPCPALSGALLWSNWSVLVRSEHHYHKPEHNFGHKIMNATCWAQKTSPIFYLVIYPRWLLLLCCLLQPYIAYIAACWWHHAAWFIYPNPTTWNKSDTQLQWRVFLKDSFKFA